MSWRRILSFVVGILVMSTISLAQAPTTDHNEKIELSTQSEAYQIGLLLRCPVCQGMPIADSPADMAQAMMKKIRTMTDEGKPRQEILDYFVSRYGEWVLLKPKQEGLNWIIWLVPPLVLLLGIGWAIVRSGASQRQEKRAIETTKDSENIGDDQDAFHALIRESVSGDDQ